MPERYAYVRIGGGDGLELRNKMLELEIWDANVKVGTLIIGKIGIKWLPKRQHRNKGHEKVLTWDALDKA